MSDLINKYPYTDFHSVNLDYILKIVRENAGLHLEVSGNQLLMKTADNTIVSAITIPYATEAGSANTANSAAYASTAGSASSAAYASTAGSAATAANATEAAHAATADTATSAASATTATNADHATTADSATTAASATSAASATYATTAGSVEHVDSAIENVTTWTNFLRFIKGDGTDILIQVPFSTGTIKDKLGNVIDSTYFASVIDDNGTLKFKDANGNVIASITPSSQTADQDSYGNTIADYIKTIATAAGSNYVTITHGNGTSETILIPYSEAAWKDTNGNVIKNFYAGSMEIVEDEDTGHYNLVVYNGDTPRAELYRFEIMAYQAQEADHATDADHATTADSATNADYATEAAHALTADSATTAVTANALSGHITPNIVQVEIKNTDTAPLSLTVGQDSDYETDVDAANIFGKLNYGEFVMLHFVDEDHFSQGSAIVNGSGGPAVIMLYENGVGPAWFQLGNNSTYTNGVNLERLS